MKWYLLERGKCPKCEQELHQRTVADVLACNTPACDFKISRTKYEELKNKITLDRMDRERETFET